MSTLDRYFIEQILVVVPSNHTISQIKYICLSKIFRDLNSAKGFNSSHEILHQRESFKIQHTEQL